MALTRLLDDRRLVRAAQVAFALLALAWIVTQLISVWTESVNGDELALMQRAERMIVTGQVDGGGRPGLGVIAVLPFVSGCTASMAAVHAARFACVLVTIAFGAALFVFLRTAVRRTPHPELAAGLGTALLVLVPTFLRYSLHVRTDQPALAAAMWGGVALFASRRSPAWSLLAGALFGTGYLFTQKAVYIVALVAVVVGGDLFIEAKLRWRREVLRAVGTTLGAVAAVAAFYLIVPLFYTPKAATTIERGLDTFGWLRRVLGFTTYREMLPTLYPHIVGLVLLVAATIAAGRRNSEHKRPLLVAVATMTLGFVVGRFHASAFPYFWMTLGVFFVTAIAIGWPGVRDLLPRAHGPIAVALVGWMLYHAVPARRNNLVDTQAVQEDTLAFIDRNFGRSRRGFHPEGALFCRRDPAPIAARFNDGLESLRGAKGPERVAALIEEHRTRPISFLVETARVVHYPYEIRTFWRTNYVDYYGPVKVAGRKIAGAAGERAPIELVAPGTYRWFARGAARGRISVDGIELTPGDTHELSAGAHEVVLVGDVTDGMLVLDLADPPHISQLPFYAVPADLTFYERLERERPPPRWTR